MKTHLLLRALPAVAAMLMSLGMAAQPTPTKVMRLYPQGQSVDAGIVENGVKVTLGPGESNGLTTPEEGKELWRVQNVGDNARMLLYLPAKNTSGQMVVVCPGGGYSMLSTGTEGACVAEWLMSEGVAACVLVYRMPNGHDTVPLQDVQNAFRYCRAHAEEWGVKQIGVMGFSAGGHLAATASTMFTDEVTRPDFSVLIYPVISFEDGVTSKGSTRRLLTGEDSSKYEKYTLYRHVTGNTPPTMLVLSADDGSVPPENSFRYFDSLAQHGVSREMYVFPHGGHGWGFTTAKYAKDGKDPLDDDYRALFFNALDNFLYKMSTSAE